jgi:hypothetical protein
VIDRLTDGVAQRRRNFRRQLCSAQFYALNFKRLLQHGREFEQRKSTIERAIKNMKHHNSERGNRQQ